MKIDVSQNLANVQGNMRGRLVYLRNSMQGRF